MTGRWLNIRKNWPLFVMLAPAVVLLFVFSYIPMAGIVIAFQRFVPAKGLFGPQEWVGLKNFAYVFSLRNTGQVIFNTVYISFFKILLGILVPLTVSLLLNEVRRSWYKRTVQTIIYFPYFISWVILSGILFDILSPSTGIVNSFLGWLGIQPIYFLGTASVFPWTIIFSDVWKNYGFNTILYMAAITQLPQDLYESAGMDGAGRLRCAWSITMPGILPIVMLTAVLAMGSILNAGFEQVYNLVSPVVYSTGDIIDTLVFRMSIGSTTGGAQYSLATAIGLFKSGVSFVMISTGYYLAYRFADYKVF